MVVKLDTGSSYEWSSSSEVKAELERNGAELEHNGAELEHNGAELERSGMEQAAD